MTTNKIIYIDDTHAQVTKAFAKRAVIFGSEEYKLWKAYRADFPGAEMTTKNIKKNPNKKTYKNLTYANMEKVIETKENKDALLAEFALIKKLSVVKSSPYHYVLDWYLQKFENSDISETITDEAQETAA